MFPQIDSEVYKLTFGNLTGITETANNSVFETENVIANTHRRGLDASRRVYRNYGTKTRIRTFSKLSVILFFNNPLTIRSWNGKMRGKVELHLFHSIWNTVSRT